MSRATLQTLEDEVSIVWLEDPLAHPYLRESVYSTTKRRGRVRCPAQGGRVVGYAEVSRDPDDHGIVVYHRRIWWLKAHDRSLDPEGVYRAWHPAEAVDPATIALGKPSRSSTA
jgi:hypothetical protein